MEILRGRNFNKEFGADSLAIIINETTAKLLEFDDPIGKKLYTTNQNSKTLDLAYTIIGVVKNFHFESLRQNVGPLAMRLDEGGSQIAFKINAANAPQLITQIESKWKALAPAMPFHYEFLDDAFDKMYRAEQRIGRVALTFAFLTILIACLGLFGLVTYIIEQRFKEIGIRKVLGADVASIVQLISKDFIKLVALAVLIASPIAWWTMRLWLQDFAFRIDIGWRVFALAGFMALVIALLTVSFQAIKAAVANPVKSLRTE
jgi:putative ABC transport system permease protein